MFCSIFDVKNCQYVGLPFIHIATCFVILGKPVFFITEMFEHMKNYELLMAKIANWMKKDGKLFVHIFTHQLLSYHFEKGTKSH